LHDHFNHGVVSINRRYVLIKFTVFNKSKNQSAYWAVI